MTVARSQLLRMDMQFPRPEIPEARGEGDQQRVARLPREAGGTRRSGYNSPQGATV